MALYNPHTNEYLRITSIDANNGKINYWIFASRFDLNDYSDLKFGSQYCSIKTKEKAIGYEYMKMIYPFWKDC